jgi:hypothetical protein
MPVAVRILTEAARNAGGGVVVRDYLFRFPDQAAQVAGCADLPNNLRRKTLLLGELDSLLAMRFPAIRPAHRGAKLRRRQNGGPQESKLVRRSGG